MKHYILLFNSRVLYHRIFIVHPQRKESGIHIYSIGSIFCPPADFLFYNLLINSVNDTKIVKVLVGYEASSKKYWKNSFTLRTAALAKLF